MTVKVLRSLVEELRAKHSTILKSGWYSFYTFMTDFGIENMFLSKQEDDELSSDELELYNNFKERVENISYCIQRYPYSKYSVFEYFTNSEETTWNILESPIGDAIEKVMDMLSDDGVILTKELMLEVQTDLSDKYFDDIWEKIEPNYSDIPYPGYILFVDLLIMLLAANISSSTMRYISYNINELKTIYNVNIDNKDEEIISLGDLMNLMYQIGDATMAKIIMYDVHNKNQWPFDGSSIIDFIYNKLKAFTINKNIQNKAKLINAKEYKEITVEKLSSLGALHLIVSAIHDKIVE